MEPVFGILLAHLQHLHEGGDDGLAIESKCLPHLRPGFPLFLLEYPAEFLGFAHFVDVLLKQGNFQVLAVKAEVVVEHFGEHTEDGSLVFVDGAFHIDIEEDGFRLALGGFVNHHECGGVILEFLPEPLHRGLAFHGLIRQKIGKHFQEVGLTTAKETGNPYADIIRWRRKSIAVIIKETHKMLLEFLGYNIFLDLLQRCLCRVLVNFDNAVDGAIDVLCEHITNQHERSLLHIL